MYLVGAIFSEPSRWRSGSPCCATGCTTSTGSSTAPTHGRARLWLCRGGAGARRAVWDDQGPAELGGGRGHPRSSGIVSSGPASHPAGGRPALQPAATTLPGRWRPSAFACATTSTWKPLLGAAGRRQPNHGAHGGLTWLRPSSTPTTLIGAQAGPVLDHQGGGMSPPSMLATRLAGGFVVRMARCPAVKGQCPAPRRRAAPHGAAIRA